MGFQPSFRTEAQITCAKYLLARAVRDAGYKSFIPVPVADLRVFIGLPLQIADACARRWKDGAARTSTS